MVVYSSIYCSLFLYNIICSGQEAVMREKQAPEKGTYKLMVVYSSLYLLEESRVY
jgi:hypothetical protein